DAREGVARDGTFIGAGIAAASQAMQARHEDDVLDDERIVPVKLLSLRQIRDAMVSAGWLAEHRRAPAHRPQDADDDFEQRRLASAVRADERDTLALLHREIDTRDDRMPRLVARGDAAQLDHAHAVTIGAASTQRFADLLRHSAHDADVRVRRWRADTVCRHVYDDLLHTSLGGERSRDRVGEPRLDEDRRHARGPDPPHQLAQ